MWESQYTSDYLAHHGILGMKWGVRRYQNEDGSLTPAGEKRYGSSESSNSTEKSKTSGRDAKSSIKEGLRKAGNKVETLENKIAKNNWTTGKKLATGAVESIGIYKIGQKVTTDLALSGHGVLATATSLGTYYAIYKNAVRISKK